MALRNLALFAHVETNDCWTLLSLGFVALGTRDLNRQRISWKRSLTKPLFASYHFHFSLLQLKLPSNWSTSLNMVFAVGALFQTLHYSCLAIHFFAASFETLKTYSREEQDRPLRTRFHLTVLMRR